MQRLPRSFIAFTFGILVFSPLPAEVFDSEKHRFKIEAVAQNLDHPWGMGFISSREVLITERPGKLLRVNLNTGESTQITGLPQINSPGQGGLLDVLLHPEFDENRWLYLSYVKGNNRRYGTEVLRAKLQDNSLTETQTLFVAQPKVTGNRHFGSRLVIDNTGYLFISLGDRGKRPSAQNLNSHLGSLIRLHDDGRIPANNPFVDMDNVKAEIFSYGHRNIQGLTLRASDQSLWLHEHGPQGGDELNKPKLGHNYGWPVITYGVNYGVGTKIGEGTHKTGMQQPVYYWSPSIAPSGMMFYAGDQFDRWQGNLFVGSLAFNQLIRIELDDQDNIIHQESLLQGRFGRIRDVRQGPDGLIYLLTDSAAGELLRISPAAE